MSFADYRITLQQVSGIQIYMQPVQDITVDDRVSRQRNISTTGRS